MNAGKIVIGFFLLLALALAVSANPILTVQSTASVDENQELTIVMTSTAPDNGDSVFEKDVSYGTLTKDSNTQATFKWKPGYSDEGDHLITFSVKDSDNVKSEGQTTVTVNNVNRAPVITSSAVASVELDDDYSYHVEATDADGDTLTFSLLESPDDMDIDSSSGVITWEPTYEDVGNNNVIVQVSDGTDTDTQEFDVDIVALRIDEVNIKIAGDDDGYDDEDDFEVTVGDTLEFEVVVDNLFSGDSNDEEIDIEKVRVQITIIDWDDSGDDVFKSDREDIGYDDSQSFDFDLGTVPGDIPDGDHDVEIEVWGDDENGVEHRATWRLTLQVDKEREDIRLVSYALEPSSVSCNRNPMLNVRLTNYGSKDSDEIVFEAVNSALGISIQDYDIDLDEGDTESLEYQLHFMSDVAPGNYAIRISSYYDMDAFDDDDVSDSDTVILTVLKCVEEEPEEEEPEEEEEEEDEVVVVPPEEDDGGEEIPVQPTEPGFKLLSKETLYILALVMLNLLVVVVIIVLLVRLARR
ncbi:hypothetical protein KY320_04375 [Candidatus Woesearchaeota archaeon]|nr:hypothetical protein [Candidatus Woesearchaeota archaeon]